MPFRLIRDWWTRSFTRRVAVLAIVGLQLFVWCACCAGADTEPQLRLLTYNIHHGEGIDGRLDLQRIADTIGRVRPDLVALQEVDQKTQRTQQVDQVQELAKLTGLRGYFGGNIELQGGRYGNAVLTNLEVVEHRNHLLPNFQQGEQRGVLEMTIRWHQQRLTVMATHLDHRPDDKERMASAEFLNRLLEEGPAEQPALLLGDLNATPDSAVLRLLTKKWSNASTMPQATIPVDRPQRQIDFVLFAPAGRWTVVETRVLDESVASDHRPLLAVLRWQPQ